MNPYIYAMENEDIKFIKNFITSELANNLFTSLMSTIEWHKTLLNMKDEPVEINRRMAYVYDTPVIYKYAGLQLQGATWTDELFSIKTILEDKTGYKFNSVLLNLYETGKDEIRWHSDKEPQLGEKPVIACLNLGAGRTFHFAKKGEKDSKIGYFVENGDLLIMLEDCQDKWLHAILPEKSIKEPRISLTFRWVYE
jgi:alkylated DNA repair dioxygenase AlkB